MHLVRKNLVQMTVQRFPQTAGLFFKETFVQQPDQNSVISAEDLVAQRFIANSPLATYRSSESFQPRVTMVTDSVSPGSLFGGVGTALILASLLAEERSARLRVVTRREPVHPIGISQVLKAYDLKLSQEPQFVFAPESGHAPIDRQQDELFLTTSWWTTVSTLQGVPAKDVLYLLQEDERMFYAQGDDLLRCEALLARQDLHVVVNTKLLFDHLVDTGLEHLADNGMWFEPAFPSSLFFPRPSENGGKRKLVFYARPNNLRNMFYLGLEVLDEAVRRGVLDLEQWEVVLVGRDIPDLRLRGKEPRRYTNLPWKEYANLVGQADAGLCLMATPHPSYPPLDLAASGAVVLTNRYGHKRDLSAYSDNIICADLNVADLVQGLEKVLRLAQDRPAREMNYKGNGLQGDWRTALNDVVRHYGGKE